MNNIIKDMSIDDYHAHPAISSTQLKYMYEKFPNLYHRKYILRDPRMNQTSPSMQKGKMCHMAVLEPELFNRTYAVAEEGDYTRASQQWKKQEIEARSQGKELMKFDEYRFFQDIHQAVQEFTPAINLINRSLKECSFFCIDDETGLQLKARPDILNNQTSSGIVLSDYKTTSSDLNYISSEAIKYKWHRQGAHHKEVVEKASGKSIDAIIYIVHNVTEYPYEVLTYEMPKDLLETGHEENMIAKRNLKKCMEKNFWPPRAQILRTITASDWFKTDIMDTVDEFNLIMGQLND